MDNSNHSTEDFPRHLILEDKVYKLSITPTGNRGRAFTRDLLDYQVEGSNPLTSSDGWNTAVGMTRELFQDYPRMGIDIPIEWILSRFLYEFVRTNSHADLGGLGAPALGSANLPGHLGKVTDASQAESRLRKVLQSWARTFPQDVVYIADIFASTDIPLETLKRSLNTLISQNQIKQVAADSYMVNHEIFRHVSEETPPAAINKISNRYYQEVQIEAANPFCFVIMPFREEEFPQDIYFDVIKKFIEDNFDISCLRVDEDTRPDRIDNKIYTYTLKSAFVIAEVSTRNPNVMYEIGLAHMLEKDCIIVTQTGTSKIPFDINKISAISYENNDELREHLRKSIVGLGFEWKVKPKSKGS